MSLRKLTPIHIGMYAIASYVKQQQIGPLPAALISTEGLLLVGAPLYSQKLWVREQVAFGEENMDNPYLCI